MDDATQKLVAEAHGWCPKCGGSGMVMEFEPTDCPNLAVHRALEAAQRPPVAEPDNHHNADVCPFCTRNRDEREAAIRAEAIAQRPPVSPEVLAKWGYEMSSPHVAEVIPWADAYEPLRDWWLTQARKIISASVPSQPVYDEEAIARWMQEWDQRTLGAYGALRDGSDVASALAAALVAALRGGELTREETNRG